MTTIITPTTKQLIKEKTKLENECRNRIERRKSEEKNPLRNSLLIFFCGAHSFSITIHKHKHNFLWFRFLDSVPVLGCLMMTFFLWKKLWFFQFHLTSSSSSSSSSLSLSLCLCLSELNLIQFPNEFRFVV